jgi:phosphoribosylanthranilate isomerase
MRIKVCGVTSAADGLLAAELGADAIGLNFYEPSARAVDMARAREIVHVLPPFVEPVAIFVAPSAERLRECTAALGVRMLQLHAASVSELAPAMTGRPYRFVLAHGVRDGADLQALEIQIQTWRDVGVEPAAVLLDARWEGLHGGTGRTAPWSLLADFPLGIPLILAGGLTAANVSEAVRIVRPYAIDVASGVERAPGLKDREKLHRFIHTAREAAARFLAQPPA